MAKYHLEITKVAEKQLKKIDKAHQRKISTTILALANNPTPEGCKKLKGYEDIYRIRIGTYRVIYKIENKKVTVVILKLGHRKDIYR